MQTQNQIIDALNPDLSRPETCTGERILLLAELFANRKARTLDHKIGIKQRPLYPLRMGFQKSACGSPFLLSHALHYSKAGYPIIRHNEKRDLFANVMKFATRFLQTLPAPKIKQDSTYRPTESGAVLLSAPSPMLLQTELKTPKMHIYYTKI